MTFSKNRSRRRVANSTSASSRLKLIKNEYVEWKKKIDDGRKLIETLADEQIIEQYKSFYEVTDTEEER